MVRESLMQKENTWNEHQKQHQKQKGRESPINICPKKGPKKGAAWAKVLRQVHAWLVEGSVRKPG